MHSFLFQDVYPWAGETRADRNFQGQKRGDREGYFMSYAHYRQISPDLAAVSAQLSQENNLKGLDKDRFVKRAAYYMDHFNHIHAFREGNGRTVQAIFFELGRQAGYKLDLTPEFREFNPARDTALIAESSNPRNNIGRLEALLARLVKPRAGKEAELARDPSQARPLAEPTLALCICRAYCSLNTAGMGGAGTAGAGALLLGKRSSVNRAIDRSCSRRSRLASQSRAAPYQSARTAGGPALRAPDSSGQAGRPDSGGRRWAAADRGASARPGYKPGQFRPRCSAGITRPARATHCPPGSWLHPRPTSHLRAAAAGCAHLRKIGEYSSWENSLEVGATSSGQSHRTLT
nr:hypothetical protein [Tanacetum cinerariifolium]